MSQISTFPVPSIPSIMFGLERSTTFFQSQKTKFIGFNKAKESVCFLIIRPYALSHKANPYHDLSFSGKILSEKRFHLCVFCSPKTNYLSKWCLVQKTINIRTDESAAADSPVSNTPNGGGATVSRIWQLLYSQILR